MAEQKIIYQCSHVGCIEKSWLGKNHDWKMCEIVFGAHPDVWNPAGRTQGTEIGVVTIQSYFNFCVKHSEVYKDIILLLIANETKRVHKEIKVDALFREGYGCWITIHDCLSHEPIKNFQIPYAVFREVFLKLPPTMIDRRRKSSEPYLLKTIESLKNVKTITGL